MIYDPSFFKQKPRQNLAHLDVALTQPPATIIVPTAAIGGRRRASVSTSDERRAGVAAMVLIVEPSLAYTKPC